MFVRESKLDDSKDAGEHSHGLLHLSEAVDLALFQRAASRDVDAKFQLNDGEAGIRWRLRYLQKQRDGQAEGWLKLHQVRRHRRERPAPLVGPRWSPTRGLKALVEADAERPRFYPVRLPAEASAPPALRLVVNALVADPLQLPLFPEKERPVSRLAHFAGHVLPAAVAAEVEARRRWRGLTQAQVAEQIGISRLQLVNALKGRFPLSQWAAARLREFMLGNATPRDSLCDCAAVRVRPPRRNP